MGVPAAIQFLQHPDETPAGVRRKPRRNRGAERRDLRVAQPIHQRFGLKVCYFASCGGQIGCTVSDFIDYFAVQPELTVILCYIEGVPDAAHFLAAARRAHANGKTVLAIKIGASESARAFALAQTGSLAGNTEAFEAMAATPGVVRLASIEDAIEAIELVARCRPPRGPRVAAVTNSGALRNLIAEAADRTGTPLAALSDATRAALSAALKESDITNPLDTKRTISTGQYVACPDALVNAPEVDIVLTAEELPRDEGAERRVANLRAVEAVAQRAALLGKPVAAFTPFITGATEYGRMVRAQIPSVPVMRDLERTLRVLRALAQSYRIRPKRPQAPESDVARILRQRAAQLDKPTALNEVESKALLRAYGIPLPQEYLVGLVRRGDRGSAPHRLPVVLKGALGRDTAQERCRPGPASTTATTRQ
jgi:acetyltransferase